MNRRDSLIGRTISHYRILQKIGEGGMGVVYKAEDTRLERNVALKFLPPELTRDYEAKARFIQEAKAASALDHPNICTIHEISEMKDGQMFTVMPFYEGLTLKEKIENTPPKGCDPSIGDNKGLPLPETIDTAIQIAQGLAKAHEKRIIHRDIKPTNIIITKDNVVKILDFGLAKLTRRTKLTKTGTTLGTVDYMSPEQAKGDDVDHRSDIWCFGVVLYEMLVGDRPFKGDSDQATLYSIFNVPPKAIRTLRTDVPIPLGRLVERCLDKDRNRRPQSMKEVLETLQMKRKAVWAFRAISRKWPRPVQIASVGLILAIAATAFLLIRSRIPNIAEQNTWRLGLLPFTDQTNQKEVQDWPLVIQAMMVDRLAGMDEIHIVDPASLNDFLKSASSDTRTISKHDIYRLVRRIGISLLIEGTIRRADTGYVVQCTMTDPLRGEVKFSRIGTFDGDRDLLRIVQNLSSEILSYFHIKEMVSNEQVNLKPWFKSRTKNLKAVKAFLQGCEYSYNMQSGGTRYFREAIRMDSMFIAPRIWLIWPFIGEQKWPEVEKEYQALLRLEPYASPFEGAVIRWVGAGYKRDLHAQAQALEEALVYSQRNNILLYFLGLTRYLLYDYWGAIEAIQPAVDMEWRYQPAHYLLGIAYSEAHQFRKAKEVLKRSLDFEPFISRTYSVLSVLAYMEKDTNWAHEYARRYTEKEIRLGTSPDSALFLMATDCSSLHQNREAIRYLRQAVSAKPLNSVYRDSLGNAFLKSGLIDSAHAEYQRVLKLDPSSFKVHYKLGLILEQKGNNTEALEHYRQYLIKDSTGSAAKDALRRISALKRQKK